MTNIDPNSCIFDCGHDYISEDRLNNYKEDSIIYRKECMDRSKCYNFKGTIIGDNCVVGAGSEVKGDFEEIDGLKATNVNTFQ